MSFLDRVSRAFRRADSWVNEITNVGTSTGRTAFDFVPSGRLSDQVLEDLYHEDAYVSRICRVVPEEALREGVIVQTGDPGLNSAIIAKLDDLHAREKQLEAWTWARVFGGAVLFVGADDGRAPWEPLDTSSIRAVDFLTAVDKREAIPDTWYDDAAKQTYGDVETYRFNRVGGSSVDLRRVHATRVIRFDGTLTTRRRKRMNYGWSDSEIQRIYDKLQQFNAGYAATGTMLQDASQGVLKMKELFTMLAGDNLDQFKKRAEMMDMMRSVGRSILIDSEESYERVEIGALGGLPETLRMFLLLLAGAAEIPVTVLMGQAPAGLNATGDSDMRWFYARIAAAQKNVLRRRIERLVRLIFLSKDGPTGGVEPASWSVEFPRLWEPTPKEEADIRATVANADALYIDKGVITPEEVATSRFRPEGWSAETSIDLGAREALLEANTAPVQGESGAANDDGTPVDPHAKDPNATLNGAQIDAMQSIMDKVAARQIPRASGIEMILSSFPIDREHAERLMGEVGTTFFTTPPPDHEAKLAEVTQAHAALQRSHASTKATLGNVMAENKAGRLVTGSPVGIRKQAEPVEGGDTPAGDVAATDAEPTADATAPVDAAQDAAEESRADPSNGQFT